MKNPLIPLLLIFTIIGPLSISAQLLPLKHFSASDQYLPLPSESIYSLYEDEWGYIWMAAYGAGIARYDGQKMQLFGAESGVPLLVVKMFQDQTGRLWICGRNRIVVSNIPLNSGHLDSLQFSSTLDGIPLLKNFSFRNTCMDAEGRIWAADESALVRYAYDSQEKLTVDTLLRTNSEDSPGKIADLFSMRNGSIWCKILSTGHLVQLEKEASTFLPIDTLISPSNVEPLTLKFEDSHGGLWASNAREYAYFRPNLDKGNMPPIVGSLKGRGVNFVQVNDTTVLGAITGRGLIEFSTRTGEILKEYELNEGLSTTGMLDMILDKGKNLWIGHAGGLMRMPLDYQAFGALTATSYGDDPPSLPEAGVNVTLTGWMDTDKKGGKPLVLAGTTKGLAILSDQGNREWLGKKGELLSSIILGLASDRENRLWISSTVSGMNCLYPPGKAGNFPFKSEKSSVSILGKAYQLGKLDSDYLYFPRIIPIPSTAGNPSQLESLWGVSRNNVQCLFKDRWIWMGTHNGYTAGTPNCITHDNEGTVFVGGSNGLIKTTQPMIQSYIQELQETGTPHTSGKAVIHAKGDIFTPIPLIWGEDTFSIVTTLLWKDENLWVGVTGGMLILSGETLEPQSFISMEGVDPGCITVSPKSNHVWVGSTSGLFEIHPESFELLRRVREVNGLMNETNWGIDVLSSGTDGTLYYGTPDGLVIYKPWLDQVDTVGFPVYIQNFDYQAEISGKNELRIRYAALSFRDESSVSYRTKLIGYDPDWSEEKKETSIRYTNLPATFFPKTYSFEVQAKDYRGEWISAKEPFMIKVDPPIWLRWWAFIIYSVILVGLAQLYAQWRFKEQLRTLALKEAETIREQRDEIQKQNAEKELLLKEIHHRVKNNLQTVSSLLNLQSEHIDDEAARAAVAAGQHRVQSMALIHQKLYQRENLAAIEMKEYLSQLGEGLLESFGVNDDQVQFKIEMEELELDVDSAIPIGLIVNELLTNSLKYAFPDEQKGEIVLLMDVEGEKSLSMTLSDNGIGASEEADPRGTSFGSQLIKLLTRQLGGKQEILEIDGFGVQFVFTRFKAL